MKTQFDTTKRVVALSNLEAMCKRISGTCHRFSVVKVTASSVHVEYSNPNEYGSEYPVTAVYPCYKNGFEADNSCVVLSAVRYVNDRDEAWQAFFQLEDCEPLFRSGLDGPWVTEYEIRIEKYPELKVSSTWDKDGCVQTWHCGEWKFPSWREAQAYAVKRIKELETNAKSVSQCAV